MSRFLIVFVAAFALIAGSASAKSSSMTIKSLTLDKTAAAPGDAVVATIKVRNNRYTASPRHKLSTFFANGILVGDVPAIRARRTRTINIPLRQIPAEWRAAYLNYRACLVGKCSRVRVNVSRPTRAPTPTKLTITPESYDFGGQHTQASIKEFVITNPTQSTKGPISFNWRYSVGGELGEGFFELQSTTCDVLAPGASCTATLYFTPGAPGGEETAAAFGPVVGEDPTPEVTANLTGYWACGSGLRVTSRVC